MSTVSSLHVLSSPHLAGAENTFLRCVQGLRRAGNPTHIAVKPGSPLARAFASPGAPYELPMRNYLDVPAVLRIRALIRQHQAEVVQSWMSRGTWLTRAPRGCLHVARLGGYYRARYFRHADAWVTVTHTLRKWMLSVGFPPDRVETIPNFVPDVPRDTPPPFSRHDLGIPEDALLIVSMGRLIGKKGYQDLIPAFIELGAQPRGRPLHLLLMGDGPMRAELQGLARAAPGRIHFTGWVDRAETALKLADLFVCPSREEAHGNVILEAWSQRLPVLATRCDGPAELILHEDDGYLAEVADPADLRRALATVIGNPTLMTQMAARGRAMFEERHSETAVVSAYVDFYQRMRMHAGIRR